MTAAVKFTTTKEADRYVAGAAGEALRSLRRQADMTQSEVAGIVRVSANQISKYERGADRMSLGTFVAISEAMGYNAADVMRMMMDGSA